MRTACENMKNKIIIIRKNKTKKKKEQLNRISVILTIFIWKKE